MVKYYRKLTLVTMLCCTIVYSCFLYCQIEKTNLAFHKEAHNATKIYSETVSLLLTDIYTRANFKNRNNIYSRKVDCNIFSTDYQPVDKTIFQLDFCDDNFTLTDEYFKLIGQGEHQRYYTSYWGCSDFKQIQKISDTYLHNNDIAFMLCLDVNGYAFFHHSVNSQMVTGDYENDNKISRQSRIWKQFSVANVKQYYDEDTFLIYGRDTGKEYGFTAYPIYVNGRQWGSAVMAYSLEPFLERRIDIITNFIFATFLSGLVLLIVLPVCLSRLEKQKYKRAEQKIKEHYLSTEIDNLKESKDMSNNLDEGIEDIFSKDTFSEDIQS